MSTPPEFSHWKEAWEWHAQQTHDAFLNKSEADLLERIQAREYDGYYQIWYSLRKIGTLEKSALVLLDVLRRETGKDNMLTRYHCAAALFYLMGYPDNPIPPLRLRVQWVKNDESDRLAAIDELESLINEKIGG